MLKRVFSVGLFAGLVSGLLIAILLHFATTPLILKAEVYETAAEAAGAMHEHDVASSNATSPSHHDHVEEADEWKPSDGFERTLSTSVATIVTGIGFSLILIAAMLVADDPITPMNALLWASGGFTATGLATGLGLAPELPGSAAADLALRQGWWIFTAFATALGLYLLLRSPKRALKSGGVALILLPHMIGAPHPQHFISTAPAELAAQFAASSLAIHAALWASVGLSVGYFWLRTAPNPRALA